MTHLLTKTCLALSLALPTTAFADWSGGYAGLSVGDLTEGTATAESEGFTADLDGDGILGGFAGYQFQSGNMVFGGEFSLASANNVAINFNGDVNDQDFRITDLKGRIGYDAGDVLVYSVLGLSQVRAVGNNFVGDRTADGIVLGLGADYAINDQFAIGAEYLIRNVTLEDEFDTDIDLDAVAVRASFQF